MSGILHDIDARGVGTITLNNPERHNAFDDRLIADMTAVLEGFAADPGVRVVVLRSTGRSFSAGADLNWMRRVAEYTEADNLRDAAALGRLMHRLDRMPKPTLAVVQGAAYGGGVGLAACCDIVLASSLAKFATTEVRLGLIPAVISPYVIAAIGARQARRYFLTADIMPAETAHRIGLVHELAAPDALDARAEAIIDTLLQQAPGAQAEAKALVFLCEGRATDDALQEETALRIARRRATAEGREGLQAFLEKRAPAWQSQEGLLF
jgi:methylglutaconyl-CoA hydratase